MTSGSMPASALSARHGPHEAAVGIGAGDSHQGRAGAVYDNEIAAIVHLDGALAHLAHAAEVDAADGEIGSINGNIHSWLVLEIGGCMDSR